MAGYKHQDLRRLFDLVLTAAPGERGVVLARECGGDRELQARIEAMIAAAEDDRFLANPTAGAPSAADAEVTLDSPSSGGGASASAVLREAAGALIGPYKLLEQIGEGGFGSVFMAEQEKPVARRVALKIIKLGMDTRQVVARFEQERQALAMMDHPNIAKVLDAGATEAGRPFFVMELVKGQPITTFCDAGKLSIEERLELFAQVCAAVQHAHTKGIIHRDIKPSNVLVSMQDGRAFAKVIDFGIAKATDSKLTEKTLFTQHQQIIGTPEYMSPEQAQGSLDIDTRTDVYSLGVLLYELLTGSTPFSGQELRSAAYDEIRRIIREVDPPPPSTRLSQSTATIANVAAVRQSEPRKLGVLVRGELDWIVMKAMDKDRLRRYETPSGLGTDVRRYLAGDAILAAPPGRMYRLRKMVRRNKGIVTTVGAVAVALLIGVIAFAWQASVARGQRDLAVAARESETEQRRIAEEQRAAADAQRDRAVAAEAETKKRAEELAKVSQFQAKMLSGIDSTAAGQNLMKDIRERYAAALAKSGVPDAQRAQRSKAFAKELEEVNATDAAVELIDGAILRPAIKEVGDQFADQPVVEATLRHSLAEQYNTLGRDNDAAGLQAQALATRRRVLGEEHPDTLLSLNNMGRILESQGKFAEAEACYRQAVEKERGVLGNLHTETLATLSNLGNLLRDQGKLAEAEPLLRESLDGRRQTLGMENRLTLISMNTYGYLLIAQGKAKEAEPYWREAYETGKRVFGADDPDVLVWTNNMGGLLGTLGRHAESEPYYHQAMDGARRVHGLEHPNTMHCVMSYASVLSWLGRSAEAETYYREVLDVRLRTMGKDHPETLFSLASLGNTLRDQGKYVEAEECLKQSLEGRRRVLGSKHPSTLVGMGLLAKLYIDQEKFDQAEALYREVLETAKDSWAPESPSRLTILNNVASVLIRTGRLDEGEPIIRQCVEARLRLSGPDHPETLYVQNNLVRVLKDRGQLDEAESLSREVLERFRRLFGDRHPNTVHSLTTLADLLTVRHKLADAEPLWREAIAGGEPFWGKESVKVALAHMGLGNTLWQLDRFAESEVELLEAERAMWAAPGGSARGRKQSSEALATLYAAWEKAEPGKGHDAKATQWKAKAEGLTEHK